MEQARRSALAHHVHRIAPMGAWVLINGTWYKTSRHVREVPNGHSTSGLRTSVMSFLVNRVDAQFALPSRHRRRRNVQHDIALAPLLDPSGQRCGIEGGGEGVALTDIAAAFM